MTSIIIVGSILLAGFICGELARALRLPKVTGYIIAGIFLNPDIIPLVPHDFPRHTGLITNIALAFITFSVGGTLRYARIKKLGKAILSITFFEAECAFLAVAVVFVFISPCLVSVPQASFFSIFIPLGLLMGSLAAPTDPAATLAVIHEYKARGEVSSTIMGVAAFDDILGIINYSIAVVVSTVLITHAALTPQALVLKPVMLIAGSILLGILSGVIFNVMTKWISRETEGALIVLIFALLSLCFGLATVMGVDERLATVAMGVVVVNFNRQHVKIFNMLERYTEELIFVLFFTVSGMLLDFSVLVKHWHLIIVFALFRALGKYLGVMAGGHLSGASAKIKKYTAGGLVPQGGIVIGLALLVQQNDLFSSFSGVLLNVIIGATVVHELIGPVLAKASLAKAGEIKK